MTNSQLNLINEVKQWAADLIYGLIRFLIVMLDGRVLAQVGFGVLCFLIVQDLKTLQALASTFGLVFMTIAFGTITRRSLFQKLDLSVTITKAVETPYGAAIIVFCATILSIAAMVITASFING